VSRVSPVVNSLPTASKTAVRSGLAGTDTVSMAGVYGQRANRRLRFVLLFDRPFAGLPLWCPPLL